MNPLVPDPENHCTFLFSDARRCQMRKRPDSDLCPHHARQEDRRRAAEQLKAELASGNLNTVTEINAVIAKVFQALAEGRISTRMANTLGYLGQLLLQSAPAVRRELNDAVGSPRAYDALLRHQLPIVKKFRKV